MKKAVFFYALSLCTCFFCYGQPRLNVIDTKIRINPEDTLTTNVQVSGFMLELRHMDYLTDSSLYHLLYAVYFPNEDCLKLSALYENGKVIKEWFFSDSTQRTGILELKLKNKGPHKVVFKLKNENTGKLVVFGLFDLPPPNCQMNPFVRPDPVIKKT